MEDRRLHSIQPGAELIRGLLCAWLFALTSLSMAAAPVSEGPFEDSACLECHQKQNPELVDAWQASVRRWNAKHGTDSAERARIQQVIHTVCQDCHAPRYITRLFENGERMLAIGRMKVKEAAGVQSRLQKNSPGKTWQPPGRISKGCSRST